MDSVTKTLIFKINTEEIWDTYSYHIPIRHSVNMVYIGLQCTLGLCRLRSSTSALNILLTNDGLPWCVSFIFLRC